MTRLTNILLIENDRMVRQALEQALTFDHYHVVAAANRADALRQFGNQPIHLLLLDLNPPFESAWETVQHLTDLQPDLPVIAMTARSEQTQSDTRPCGVDAVMEKPLDLPFLIETLNKLVTQTPEARRRCRSHYNKNHAPSSTPVADWGLNHSAPAS